ncbi:MAG: hypothetical protein VXW83_03160, partial [SAR324 cluster bacterium]|nr:hypothetical protein [SAR324 cluster bacterium]
CERWTLEVDRYKAEVSAFRNPSFALKGTFYPKEKVLSRIGKWLKLQLLARRPNFQKITGRGKKIKT